MRQRTEDEIYINNTLGILPVEICRECFKYHRTIFSSSQSRNNFISFYNNLRSILSEDYVDDCSQVINYCMEKYTGSIPDKIDIISGNWSESESIFSVMFYLSGPRKFGKWRWLLRLALRENVMFYKFFDKERGQLVGWKEFTLRSIENILDFLLSKRDIKIEFKRKF